MCHNNVNEREMKIKTRAVILLVVVGLFPLQIFSQITPPSVPPPPPPGLPIDGGLLMLAAGAVCLGVRKIRK